MRTHRSILTSWLLALGTMTTTLAQPVETVLHNFSSPAPKGAQPIGSLIQDADGTLYGATESEGRYGNGTIPGLACRMAYSSPCDHCISASV